MDQSKLNEVIKYSESLIGIPYRWYIEELDTFNGKDKFWCENTPPPSACEIILEDKCIVCTGLINLMRRKNGFTIPGLNGNIKGKYNELYKKYPGGTGAWFLYLHQCKRLYKIDLNFRYPKGTLLLAKFKDNENDQGHVAVVYNDNDYRQTINNQLIIHSSPDILYKDKDKYKNHGILKIEEFWVSNDKWKNNKKSYYTHVCFPENWLLMD
jgi:hypothetical protein